MYTNYMVRWMDSPVTFEIQCTNLKGFPGGSDGKELPHNVGDLYSIPGLERSSGEGNVNLLQCSYLENPEGQRSLVGCSPWVAKSQTCLRPILE